MNFFYFSQIMQHPGIEPRRRAPQAVLLPLHCEPLCQLTRFRTITSAPTVARLADAYISVVFFYVLFSITYGKQTIQ